MVMSDDHPVSMSGPLSQLLEDGMRVLVYNGDQDFNWYALALSLCVYVKNNMRRITYNNRTHTHT